MSADELLEKVRERNPGVRYARAANGTAVGEWVESRGRFVPVYMSLLGGQWACMITGGMIREILTDGRPCYAAGDWAE
jgi:hypothetical protein